MMLHISDTSSQTLQEQIIDQIRARILSGDLEPDFHLPSIRALAKDIKVSVITVQRAYEQLLNEDMIYARRGKGFFVARLQDSDKSALAQQRFGRQLIKLIAESRRDGLQDQEIRDIFQQALGSGDKTDHA